jgi:hypothetical protein
MGGITVQCETCGAAPYVNCECADDHEPNLILHLAHERLDTLASNLAVAAGLCRANVLGYQRGIHDAYKHVDDDSDLWRHGCGRSAP